MGTSEDPCNGIVGPTIISEYVNLSYTPIDYMHLICLGIFKHILITLFDSKNKDFPYYIGKIENILIYISKI